MLPARTADVDLERAIRQRTLTLCVLTASWAWRVCRCRSAVHDNADAAAQRLSIDALQQSPVGFRLGRVVADRD